MSDLINPSGTVLATGEGASSLVQNVTLANFKAEVMDASHNQLVIVDFWAPWCGPCKQLGPLLEKLVLAQNGAVRLAKIDIDANPEIAQQMRVQSIPAVFAFFRGQPVDGFMGALPESQVKTWIDRLLKATGGGEGDETAALQDALKMAAEDLADGDVAGAQALFADVLRRDPKNADAYAGILRCLLAEGKIDLAQQRLSEAPDEMAKDKALEAVRTALELAAEATGAAGSLPDLLARVEANPDDHQAHYDLALAHYACGQTEKAIDALLDIVRRNRKWNDEAARKQLLKLFEALGPTNPLTVDARKRLSSILFS